MKKANTQENRVSYLMSVSREFRPGIGFIGMIEATILERETMEAGIPRDTLRVEVLNPDTWKLDLEAVARGRDYRLPTPADESVFASFRNLQESGMTQSLSV